MVNNENSNILEFKTLLRTLEIIVFFLIFFIVVLVILKERKKKHLTESEAPSYPRLHVAFKGYLR